MYVFIVIAFNGLTLIWDISQSALFCFVFVFLCLWHLVPGRQEHRPLCADWRQGLVESLHPSILSGRMLPLSWRLQLDVTILFCCPPPPSIYLSIYITIFIYYYYFFVQSYPEQSLLLVVTGALGLRVLNSPLVPVLPVFNTFKVTSGSRVTSLVYSQYCVSQLWAIEAVMKYFRSGVHRTTSGFWSGSSTFWAAARDAWLPSSTRWRRRWRTAKVSARQSELTGDRLRVFWPLVAPWGNYMLLSRLRFVSGARGLKLETLHLVLYVWNKKH